MVAALSDGRIQIEVVNGIAVVRSAHRAATMLGQCVAPIAVCFHPAFRWPSGAVTPKATIVWAVPPSTDEAKRVVDALNAREPGGGWGGNLKSGIIGSPQGRASALSEAEILACVRAPAVAVTRTYECAVCRALASGVDIMRACATSPLSDILARQLPAGWWQVESYDSESNAMDRYACSREHAERYETREFRGFSGGFPGDTLGGAL